MFVDKDILFPNDNASPFLQNDISSEEENERSLKIDYPINDMSFPSPSTSKSKISKNYCSNERHQSAVEILQQIVKKKLKNVPVIRKKF